MKLMIVESPNKVRKIKSILGAGWEVAASVGHIRDLPVKEMGVAPPEYTPTYELSERGADVVKRLRGLAAKADEGVYLATDPDREGEAIAWHVQQALKLKRAERVTFDAITPEVVRRALTRPRAVDLKLVRAQEARRVLDRLVGYQVSPALGRGLSAGRVQSPAVRLVVEREREIATFVEVRHFGAELSFDGGAWRAQWLPPLKEGEKYCLDEALAQRAAACRLCTVTSSGNKIVKQPPPPPFTTSTMLQAASVRLRWKPEVTAGVAQKLFEAGLITYHRTDSVQFSAEALREVRAYAEERGLPLPPRARAFRSKGGAQEAHEAVRPTHFSDEHAGEDPAQKALYRLIWERAMASQLADAEWSVNTTLLSAVHGAETFLWKAEGRLLVNPGWKQLTARDAAGEEDEPEGDGRVPVLAPGSGVTAESGRVLYKKTEPPPRFSQAALIKRLESLGIGRPSTYPAILKNVLDRNYLRDEGKHLQPTPTGEAVVDGLVGRFGFVEYAFTRALEEDLDRIAEGAAEYAAVVRGADERLLAELAKAGPVRLARPATGNFGSAQAPGFVRRDSKASAPTGFLKGRLRSMGTAQRSSGPAETPQRSTRAAKRAAHKERGAANPDGTVEPKKARGVRKGKGAPADASAPAPASAGAISCPVCKAGFVRLPREDAKAWGCSKWPETHCPLTIWRTIAGRPVIENEVRALCRNGKTEKLSGFVSKAGKPFEASLQLDKEGKVELIFR